MKKLLLFFSLALLASFGFANIANYTFGYSAGTYTEITEGTATSITTDDGAENIVLPFGFNYDGTRYYNARICANGWMILYNGTAPTATAYTNNLSGTSILNAVCPLWDDLNPTGTPTAVISYKTLGSGSDRVFVVQWKDIKWYGSSGTAQNFQVRLEENGNLIKFVYGTMNTPTGSASASIGLIDAVGGSGHFLSVTPGNPPTVSSTTANNTISAITYLTSGTTYTFTPDGPSTYPNLATVVYPTNGAVAIPVNANLSWADGGGWTDNFKLYLGTTNGDTNPPWNMVNGSDLGYVMTYDPPDDFLPNTTYYWKIVPHNSFGDNPDAVVWNFLTAGPPLSGIKTVGGTNPDYATLAEAIAALNNGAFAGPGGVTFNVRANHTERISTPLVITATGSSGNEIVFRKDPASTGANPLITRTDAGSNTTSTLGGLGDAIIRLDGTDYITFDGIDLKSENSGIEYGFMTNKLNGTDGCQNVTIKNSVITMTKGTSGYVVGIYISNGPTSASSNAGVTVTAASGINQNVLIAGNTIQNVHCGIFNRSYSTTYFDNNITIGQAELPNVIQNFGGGSATTTYGIYLYYTSNPTVAYTTINNAGGGGSAHAYTLYGIYNYYVTGVVTDDHNVITLSNSSTYASNWIYTSAGTPVPTSQAYTNNTFAAGAFASTSSSYLIYASDTTPDKTISGNVTSGTINKTGSSGTLYLYYNLGSPASGTETITNNNFSNITVAGSSAIYGLYSNTAVGQARVCTNNTVSNWTGGSGTIYSIYMLSGSTNQVSGNTVHDIASSGNIYGIGYSGTTPSVYDNTIYNLSTTGASSVYGIYQSGATTANCRNNKVYNLSSNNASSYIYGIYISSGTTTNVYNNMIYGLSAPGSTSSLSAAIMGIRVTAGTTNNIFYNSCLLNYNSSNAYFSAAGLYLSGGTTNVIKNNIFVNKCVAGASGKSVGIWSSATAAPYYIGAGSDKNIYYAPIVAYINSVSYNTLEQYKTFLADREQGSYYEDVPFVSSAPPIDLHISTTEPTRVEGNAVTLYPDFDTDFDYDNRNDVTPDIGADEGNFQVPVGAPGNVTLLTPADAATGINPFNCVATWSAPTTGGTVAYYVLFVASSPETIFDEYFMDPILAPATSFNLADVPNLTMDYLTDYYWAVVAYSTTGEPSDVDAPDFQIFRFTTSGQLIAPNSLPLGNALAGYTKKGSITVNNIGNTNLTFTAASSDEIVLGDLRYTLPANSSAQLPYTFNVPATVGPYTGFITLTETSPGSSVININVTAAVTDSTIIGGGTVELQLPVDPFYRYSYSQSIFYPSEIGWSPDYRINKIYYYFNGYETCEQTKSFVIYMGHTNKNVFSSTTDWISSANMILAYEQINEPQQATGGYWMEFDLDTPFLYNCTENLVIAVGENYYGTAYDATGNYFYCTSTPSVNRSIRYLNDSTYPDTANPPAGTLVAGFPNIKFDLELVPPAPQITVAPASWGFGTVIVNNYAVKQFTVYNAGGGSTPLIIDNITVPAGYFSLLDLPVFPKELQSGQSTTFKVKYLPTAAGNHNAIVTIDDNLTDYEVAVSGICVDPRITSLPYAQNFDGVTTPALPLGWTAYKSNSSASVISSTTYAQSTPNSVYMYNYTTTDILRLISPEVTVPMNSFKVKFYARGGSAGNTLKVGTVNALDGTGVFTQLGSFVLTASFAQYSVSFTSYTGTDHYICFQHGTTSTYQSIYLDNVSVEQIFPVDMKASAITGPTMSTVGTQQTFNITVVNNGSETANAYDVYLKLSGGDRLTTLHITTPLAPDAQAVHAVNWTPLADNLYNLVGGVDITGDGYSGNNETAVFQFLAYPEGTWIEGFEGGAIPSDWTIRSGDGGSYNWEIYNSNAHTGTYCAAVRWESTSLQNDDWLITPPLQLSSSRTDAIAFYIGKFSTTYPEDWQVLISTTDSQMSSFTMIDSGDLPTTGYTMKAYNLDSYGDAVVYIALRYVGLDDLRFYADDFIGSPLYVPAQPTVTVEKVPTGIKLSWPADIHAKSYKIYSDTDPYGTFSGTPITTTSNQYIFTDVSADKKFYKVVASTKASGARDDEQPVLSNVISPEELQKMQH
ncbi:MAG TPA: choice-of-anchor J domain-containing protein [Candidatus Cloacimonadota bacterium]|nr:choice-of-anchor J domain-containing protein [Candidatus Cloacimonadota bacterium]HQL15142.1 choice-of-anchor J domain-containing protein [Candidatus Cloacimonadota bacterium]